MENLFLLIFLGSFVCLIIGLIKPSSFSKFLKGEITRKRIGKIFGISIIVSFVLFGITTETPEDTDNQTENHVVVENTQNTEIVEEKEENIPMIVEESGNITVAPVKEDEIQTASETTPVSLPTQTQTEEVDKQDIIPVSTETVSQKNAIRSAKAYLDYSAFSREGLIKQLEYEKFSHVDAVYGTDNSGADWNEQAAKSAEQYLDYSSFSRGGLIGQLLYEGFTQGQAEYGVNSVGL
ncbi:MAG: Ltp family lipoprotein [Patescibacteria group bacterium]